MSRSTTLSNEPRKFNTKKLAADLFYSAIKGASGFIFKAFMNLKIEGKENIPIRGKAILTTISKNVIRDMLIISQATGRKVHFMLNPKLMKHQVAGPVLNGILQDTAICQKTTTV